MSYATPITIDLTNGGLKTVNGSGTYKSYTGAWTLSWNAENMQSLCTVFSLMQGDMQRAFDFEQPGLAERVATDWRSLVAKGERYGSLNQMMVTEMYNQVNFVLKSGYERLGQGLPPGSATKTPESAQQPGMVYTPPVQSIPPEMLEPPVITGGATPVPGTAQPSKTVTYNVVTEQPPVMPSGPGGGIVQAQPAEAGIPWKWIALGLGALFLLRKRR